MRKLLIGTGLLIMLLGNLSFTHGQQQTERFIPIGQSPGLSGKYTITGKIETINTGARSFTVAGPSGPMMVTITDKTHIWLDRSQLKLTNLRGGFAHLQTGRMVEVKYKDHKRKQFAEWVKVRVTEGDTISGVKR